MISSALIVLAAFILLVIANAIFVAVEFSYLTVNRNDVRKAAKSGSASASLVDKALSKTSTNLSGAQLGITVTSLLAGFLTGPSLGVLLQAAFAGSEISTATVTAISTTGAFIIATFTQMVFGELVPKNWAIAQPQRVANLVVRPQNLFMFAFGWLVWLLNSSANWILKKLGFSPEEEVASARTAEELRAVVTRSGDEGTINPQTAELVARSIEFGERTAADVMTPRPQIVFVQDQNVAEMLDIVAESGHARFPVIGESVDDIRGVIHYTDLLALPYDKRLTTSAASLAKEVLVVNDSTTLDPLMRQLREDAYQFAVVVDEYGGTDGIVTLEDLVEEIVGEIDDEQDNRSLLYSHISPNTVIISGLMRPDELGEILNLVLPEGEESDTIGGFITEKLDRMPRFGDTITVEATDHENVDEENLPTTADVTFRVERMARHRVGRVRVHVDRQEV
ncbi:MAG: hemolysin family protein [Corynebacterium sp.]|uniref:hemolysin family protein n=1 Tax=Corynebacterium sp. TaxID=1720 RepID=UPI0026DBCD1F|nr:hemolysin family protein [Corynebacterium sp.]MDO5029015.1 hemolysin family protein [Corynebacterium sp.]